MYKKIRILKKNKGIFFLSQVSLVQVKVHLQKKLNLKFKKNMVKHYYYMEMK